MPAIVTMTPNARTSPNSHTAAMPAVIVVTIAPAITSPSEVFIFLLQHEFSAGAIASDWSGRSVAGLTTEMNFHGGLQRCRPTVSANQSPLSRTAAR